MSSPKRQPRCRCGSFVGKAGHDCAAAIDERLRTFAYTREFHRQRWIEAVTEGSRRRVRNNIEAARQSVRRAHRAWMAPRLARRAAIDWRNVGQLRVRGLTWRRIAFMHREPETTFKRWARSELAHLDCRSAA